MKLEEEELGLLWNVLDEWLDHNRDHAKLGLEPRERYDRVEELQGKIAEQITAGEKYRYSE